MYPQIDPSRVLVLTIAVGGYQIAFKKLIDSHAGYAKRMGYRHCLVQRIGKLHPRAAPWLKISVVAAALRRGYRQVLVVDADCLIRSNTPGLEHVVKPGKTIYGAEGFSGQLNSGFVLFCDEPQVERLLATMLANCEGKVAGGDWGENGHLNFYLRNFEGLALLPRCWNNNCNPDEFDYIRHFCGGTAMAQSLRISWWRRGLLAVLRYRLYKVGACHSLQRTVEQRTLYCLAQFPVLHQAGQSN